MVDKIRRIYVYHERFFVILEAFVVGRIFFVVFFVVFFIVFFVVALVF